MVSVIIPVYNVEKYISECLESLIHQTYKDIEIIIVNDGSTDSSEEIIKSYLEESNNIIYIYQKNKGTAEARNKGIESANGDYVLFVDSDDYLDKDMIQKMYNSADKNNSDVVVCGHIKFYDGNSSKNKIINYDGYENNIYNGKQVLDLMLSLRVKGYLCDKLFKRKKLLESDFKLEPNRYIEDWFPVIKQIKQAKIITFINEPLYYYRQRNGSALHTINKKLLDDYVYTVDIINDYLDKNEVQYDKECKNAFDCETFYSVIRYFYLNNYKDKKQSDIYKKFVKSDYYNHVKFNYSFFINKRIDLSRKLKLLLWKLKIYHLFVKNK